MNDYICNTSGCFTLRMTAEQAARWNTSDLTEEDHDTITVLLHSGDLTLREAVAAGVDEYDFVDCSVTYVRPA